MIVTSDMETAAINAVTEYCHEQPVTSSAFGLMYHHRAGCALAALAAVADLIISATLEQAAKVADDKEDGLVNHSKRFPTNPNIAHEYLVRAADASDIAAAIRALKGTRTPAAGEIV